MARAYNFDPDGAGRDSVLYWGAVLAQAVRDRDAARAQTARAELRRLRCNLAWRPRRATKAEARP